MTISVITSTPAIETSFSALPSNQTSLEAIAEGQLEAREHGPPAVSVRGGGFSGEFDVPQGELGGVRPHVRELDRHDACSWPCERGCPRENQVPRRVDLEKLADVLDDRPFARHDDPKRAPDAQIYGSSHRADR